MQVPQHSITILLGLVFCIMNPIITPVCLIYFLITTVAEKYNLLYVYTFEYQSGGKVRSHPSQVLDQKLPLLPGLLEKEVKSKICLAEGFAHSDAYN